MALSDNGGPLRSTFHNAVYQPQARFSSVAMSYALSDEDSRGLLRALAALLLLCVFIARVRMYDSLGEYKGIGNIGMAPLWLFRRLWPVRLRRRNADKIDHQAS